MKGCGWLFNLLSNPQSPKPTPIVKCAIKTVHIPISTLSYLHSFQNQIWPQKIMNNEVCLDKGRVHRWWGNFSKRSKPACNKGIFFTTRPRGSLQFLPSIIFFLTMDQWLLCISHLFFIQKVFRHCILRVWFI